MPTFNCTLNETAAMTLAALKENRQATSNSRDFQHLPAVTQMRGCDEMPTARRRRAADNANDHVLRQPTKVASSLEFGDAKPGEIRPFQRVASAERMRAHIECLCDDNEILVNWNSRYARGAKPIREIWIPTIKSEISYAVALHEIGHVCGRHQDSRLHMVLERWAWEYARKTALFWTRRMERCAADSLDWYSKRIEAGDHPKCRERDYAIYQGQIIEGET